MVSGSVGTMGTDVQLFESAEFGSVRVVVKDGEPWFVAKDVCACLDLANPRSSLALLDEDEKGVYTVDTPGGKQEMAIVSEAGLYSLVLRSRKPEAKAFKRWITHEVLPSIRKTGGYSLLPTKDDAERLMGDPDFMIMLFTEIKEERAKSAALQAQVDEMEPKARYHDNVLNSDKVYTATQIAKDYGMSARAFNKLLHEMGIQFSQGGQWHLYARYQDLGYTKSVTELSDNGLWITYTAWTEKGREFLYYELAKRGVYPTADSELSPADARSASQLRLEAGAKPSVGRLEALGIKGKAVSLSGTASL